MENLAKKMVVVMGALLVLLFAACASAEADIRGELDVLVGLFNKQAGRVDRSNADSIKAFNDFIGDFVEVHWDTEFVAISLLGDSVYSDLSQDQQQQVQQSLKTTFYRYTYEILETYKQAPLILVDSLVADQKGRWRIKIIGKPKFLPALTGEVYLTQKDQGWAIVDIGYAGWTYISVKRRLYQRKFAQRGLEGLLAWLDEKNQRYFADYCHLDLRQAMPSSVVVLCEPS